MALHRILSLLILVTVFSLRSHATEDQFISPEISKYLVIIGSFKSYGEATESARIASKKMSVDLNLRELEENKKIGLSFSKEVCLSGPVQSHPCYRPRGKYDDGEYISIEHSSGYREMQPGLFVLISFSSGNLSDTKRALKRWKSDSLYKTAYIKKVSVYMAGE